MQIFLSRFWCLNSEVEVVPPSLIKPTNSENKSHFCFIFLHRFVLLYWVMLWGCVAFPQFLPYQSDPPGWQDLSRCGILQDLREFLCTFVRLRSWVWGRAAAFPNFPRICPQCQNVPVGNWAARKCRHVFSNEISRFMRTFAPQMRHYFEDKCFQMRYHGLWGRQCGCANLKWDIIRGHMFSNEI